MKTKTSWLYFLLVAVLAGSLVIGFLPHILWSHWSLESTPLHSFLSFTGALAAILLAVILLQRMNEEETRRIFPMAIGLLGMGILEGIHGVALLGNTVVLLHTLACLVGSFCFALIWLPGSAYRSDALKPGHIAWLVAAGSVLLGTVVLLFGEEGMPPMLRNGKYTHLAVAINILAGLLFTAAGGRFLLDFHRSGKLESGLFASMALLFGLPGLLFKYSEPWDDVWWAWHLLRTVAYLLAAGLMIREYQRTISELGISLTERKQAEEKLRRNYDIQSTITSILRLSLEDITLERLLGRVLDLILSIPWLALRSMGSISLVEDQPEVLVMKAQKGLSEPIQKECARLRFGRCLCGRAAQTQQIQFADRIDERHDTTYEGIIPHGHYCVPLLLGDQVLGVLNLYLNQGHLRDPREEEFLTAAANALAGVIVRRRTEEMLFQSEARYRAVLEQSADGIYLVDVETKHILEANLAFAQMLGYTAEEIRGLSVHDIVAAEQEVIDQRFQERVNGKGPSSYERQYRKKDGSLVEVWVSFSLISYGGRKVMCALVRDLTERKRAEQEREKLIAELQEALANIKTLSGLIPICAQCKKIRDDKGYWQQVEAYIHAHSEAEFSHGLCPDCAEKFLADLKKDASPSQGLMEFPGQKEGKRQGLGVGGQ